MAKYLLKAWGVGEKIIAEKFPPDKIHGSVLHWYFDTLDELARFRQGIPLLVTSIMEGDIYRRTILKAKFKLPNGELRDLEHDFGYGYDPDSAIYMFEEGNYSCDCNRSTFLNIEQLPCGDTIELLSIEIEKDY